MKASLIKIVQSVNRSWTHDSYFSLHRPLHGGIVRGKCPDTLINRCHQSLCTFVSQPFYLTDSLWSRACLQTIQNSGSCSSLMRRTSADPSVDKQLLWNQLQLKNVQDFL